MLCVSGALVLTLPVLFLATALEPNGGRTPGVYYTPVVSQTPVKHGRTNASVALEKTPMKHGPTNASVTLEKMFSHGVHKAKRGVAYATLRRRKYMTEDAKYMIALVIVNGLWRRPCCYTSPLPRIPRTPTSPAHAVAVLSFLMFLFPIFFFCASASCVICVCMAPLLWRCMCAPTEPPPYPPEQPWGGAGQDEPNPWVMDMDGDGDNDLDAGRQLDADIDVENEKKDYNLDFL